MPLPISTQAIIEKNKLTSEGAWIILLEVNYPGEDPIYLCDNTEDVVWNGKTWKACSFRIGEIQESKEAEVPTVPLTIVDIQRKLIPVLDQYKGGIGATVTLRIVNSNFLDNTVPEFEMTFEIIDVFINSQFQVKFSLGAENLLNYRSPKHRYLKNFCRYKEFKGPECGYTGPETECDRTLERCKQLGNQVRFGGFPGIGRLGYIR